MVAAVLLSNGDCVTTPLLTVVWRGPRSAASYLNASLSRLISRAAPMRLGQCASYWPGWPELPRLSMPGLDMFTSTPLGVMMRSQITAMRGPFGTDWYLPSTFEPFGSSSLWPLKED